MIDKLHDVATNIRNLLILLLAGHRTIVINAKLEIIPYEDGNLLTLRGVGGLYCNVRAPLVNGMVIQIDQFNLSGDELRELPMQERREMP